MPAFLPPFRALTALCCLTAVGCGASASAPGVAMPPEAPPPMMDAGGPERMSAETPVTHAGPGAAPVPIAPGAAPEQAPAPRGPTPPAPMKSQGAPATSPRNAKEVGSAKGNPSAPGVEQMIIFTGELHLTVDDGTIDSTLREVIDEAVERGGYIHAQDNVSVTIRVPSGAFRQTMRELEDFGEVSHRHVQAQDVSERFHDLEVRLKSHLATRTRLEKFLDRAKTIDEVLRIEQELTRLNTAIDQIRGKMRFLQARAAYSTITVRLKARPKPPPKLVKKEEKKRPPPPPPPPPPPRTLHLPIPWLTDVDLGGLLNLDRND